MPCCRHGSSSSGSSSKVRKPKKRQGSNERKTVEKKKKKLRSRSRSPPGVRRQRAPSSNKSSSPSPAPRGGERDSGPGSRPDELVQAPTIKPVQRIDAASDLPIAAFRDQIIKLIVDNNIIVVVGETGSGKTTQIPQYLLDAVELNDTFAGVKRRIAITQPRRVAAMAMAKRVSQVRGTRLGAEVGYTIRFEDNSNPETSLRYMTDGCLLRECLGDPDLTGYCVVILDEAHERSLHTDVLFALMKRAVASRAGKLRVVVTSATLDTGAFSKYFNDCPVLQVPGREYKVDIHYHPVSKTQRVESCVNVALNLHVREGPGHILVFLTGMEECEQAVAAAHTKLQNLLDTGKEVSDCMIVPLYGMMQSDDQRNVFDEVPEGCRKLIFSTNIAETSLTVTGVGYVIDCGYCKQKNYNPKTGMESLQVTEVSQVQATQRSGRAGRTQDGKCFRLYSEETYKKSFPAVTVPEILRSNLTSVTLQMKAMGIDNVVGFDFMEPPDRVRLIKSLRILFLIGCIDEDGKLTDVGKSTAQFPLEPQFARSLLEAGELGCLAEAVTLVSMLSSEGVWYRPSRTNSDEIRIASATQQQFVHPIGDLTTLLNVYRQWEENGCNPDWCKRNYLHHRALRQAREIRKQLCEQLAKSGREVRESRRRRDEGLVVKALCAGFYMQTARMCSAGGGWLVVGENVLVKPEGGSAIDGQNPEWLLFTELIGNTIAHVMMRNVSAVDYSWLQPLLPKLNEVDLKRLVGDWRPEKKIEEPTKDPAVLAKERECKVGSAKERYLARKAGRG